MDKLNLILDIKEKKKSAYKSKKTGQITPYSSKIVVIPSNILKSMEWNDGWVHVRPHKLINTLILIHESEEERRIHKKLESELSKPNEERDKEKLKSLFDTLYRNAKPPFYFDTYDEKNKLDENKYLSDYIAKMKRELQQHNKLPRMRISGRTSLLTSDEFKELENIIKTGEGMDKEIWKIYTAWKWFNQQLILRRWYKYSDDMFYEDIKIRKMWKKLRVLKNKKKGLL